MFIKVIDQVLVLAYVVIFSPLIIWCHTTAVMTGRPHQKFIEALKDTLK